MTAAVVQLQPTTTMTVEQCLASVVKDQGALSEVLVCGYRDGELYVRSSRMSRRDALWMSEALRLYALEGLL